MAASPERPDAIGVDELKTLETSVLKTLCLTINTAGSELKYKILDSLSDDDFYFPVLRALFSTLSEMHRRGDYVISANLEEELQKADAEIPAGFSIEQLFDGSLPSLADLNGWVSRLKERSRSGMIPTVRPVVPETPAPVPSQAEQTVVKPLAEVKKRIAEEVKKSNPAVAEVRSIPPASSPAVPVTPPAGPKSQPAAPVTPPAAPKSQPAAPVTPPPAPRSQPAAPAKEKSSPAVASSKRTQKAVLSSEADDWSSYLEDLAAQQGVRFDTGFPQLDGKLGGLAPGLMLLIDEDRERVVSFLKQVTDQFASTTPGRCLFLAADKPKAALRLRTISRLARVPLGDLEKGRLKKDSPEWRRVDAAGRGAQDWLRRVFVYEAEEEIELPLLRELVKKLLEASEEKLCLVVVDALEKVSRPSGPASSVVSQLKSLADSLEVLIVAAATDPTLLASKDTDYAAVFRNMPQGVVELELLRAGKEDSTVVQFRYDPQTCGFTEV